MNAIAASGRLPRIARSARRYKTICRNQGPVSDSLSAASTRQRSAVSRSPAASADPAMPAVEFPTPQSRSSALNRAAALMNRERAPSGSPLARLTWPRMFSATAAATVLASPETRSVRAHTSTARSSSPGNTTSHPLRRAPVLARTAEAIRLARAAHTSEDLPRRARGSARRTISGTRSRRPLEARSRSTSPRSALRNVSRSSRTWSSHIALRRSHQLLVRGGRRGEGIANQSLERRVVFPRGDELRRGVGAHRFEHAVQRARRT